jgi:hypothetical protein
MLTLLRLALRIFMAIVPFPAAPPVEPLGEAAAKPSLDIVFDEMKRRLDAQDEQVEALNAKAAFAFTAASVLAAGLGTFGSTVAKPHWTAFWSFETLAIAPFLALYCGLIACCLLALQVLRRSRSPEPKELIKYATASPEKTKYELADAWMCAFELNRDHVERQADWVGRALALLAGEVVWIVAIVVGRLVI